MKYFIKFSTATHDCQTELEAKDANTAKAILYTSRGATKIHSVKQVLSPYVQELHDCEDKSRLSSLFLMLNTMGWAIVEGGNVTRITEDDAVCMQDLINVTNEL